MTLLKIVFYAHGWYLATKGIPLFKQPVEAREYGPVVKVVRDSFKVFGKKPIDKFAERLDLMTGELIPMGSDLEKDDEVFVRSVFELYIEKTAYELSDMTHEVGGPWDKVWNSKVAVGSLGLRIKNDDIRAYFNQMRLSGTLH